MDSQCPTASDRLGARIMNEPVKDHETALPRPPARRSQAKAGALAKAGQSRTNPDGFAQTLQFRPAVPEQSEGGSQAKAGLQGRSLGEGRSNPDKSGRFWLGFTIGPGRISVFGTLKN